MIHVYRSLVITPIPPELRRAAYKEAQSFFALPLELRQQRRFSFDNYLIAWAEVRTALSRLFHAKCAYCEIALESDSGVVHRHRPPSDTLTERREHLPDHYWWLAYHWSNLYLACSACNRAKASHFPIEGRRSPVKGNAADLREELPRLLDPCVDRPHRHLIFDNDGVVYGRTWRGQETIERLDLNREKLVSARREALLNRAISRIAFQDYAVLDRAVDSEIRRIEFIGAIKSNQDLSLSRRLQAELRQIKDGSFPYNEGQRDRFQFTEERGLPYVQSIRVRSVGPIEDLSIHLSDAESSRVPWLAIIGENSVGKSTILKSIALTLTHQKTRSRLKIGPQSISDASTGDIEVKRASGPSAILTWTTPGRFSPCMPPRSTLVLAYGSTRLTVEQRRGGKPIVKWERIGNLFNPFVALNLPERWLLSIENEEFEYAARALKTLLNLPQDAFFERDIEAQTVELHAFGRLTRVTKLSDGLQSVLSLACDIMASAFELWGAPEIAEGVVLIDEIENHLHPKWKMKIVDALRKAFPRLQFIMTTHDPLCLKGLEDGEVVVLRRDPEGLVKAVENLPPISRMRVDQILTSEHFGLASTLDPHTEALYERYYTLLRDTPESSVRTKELAEIMKQLDESRLMGSTRRERLMLEAIDRYLSNAPEVQLDAEQLSNQLKEKLSAILKGKGQAGEKDRT